MTAKERKLKIGDLFCGRCGASKPFKDRGHDVVTVDFDPKFKPDICADISKLQPEDLKSYGPFDFIWSSNPCNCFSVASIYRHWNLNKTPKDEATLKSIEMLGHTVSLILSLHPRFWIIENPRGMMRNVLGKPTITTYFASWGHWALKPTDLWGVIPDGIPWTKPRKWIAAPRGSHSGVQGIDGQYIKEAYPQDMSKFVRAPDLRAEIPYGLGLAICLAIEKVVAQDEPVECVIS